ncbi:MAG: helical backbone metal receptor [Planctomycetota bacterium]|jgi:ABC-type hemin transport system substrate-binding protein|nr:helical backbone metal receptor [Planctomycetota bacterium]MDP6955509.1 helical backbone metal receptor [Planctomycetota bacterium]
MRIVSLCPSLTEMLFDLGRGDELVGITDWCIHPAQAVSTVEKVGGTKTPDTARIIELAPDIVLLNDEENRLEDARVLEGAGINCLSTFPKTVLETAQMVRTIGAALCPATQDGDTDQGFLPFEQLAGDIEDGHGLARARSVRLAPVRFAYLIWRQPWMAVGADTYASDLIGLAGGENVLAGSIERYGEVEPATLAAARPDLVLLCTEPFPFDETHAAELADLTGLPRASFSVADGEFISWHGSRTPAGIDYAADLLDAVRQRT